VVTAVVGEQVAAGQGLPSTVKVVAELTSPRLLLCASNPSAVYA
jgi:hypothetical protein